MNTPKGFITSRAIRGGPETRTRGLAVDVCGGRSHRRRRLDHGTRVLCITRAPALGAARRRLRAGLDTLIYGNGAWRPGWYGANAAGRERAERWGCSSCNSRCNTLWSWLFFGWHRGGLAFADIVVMLALIVATMVAFARIRRLAAWLLAPYLAWVSFAALLNYSVWQLNPLLLQ